MFSVPTAKLDLIIKSLIKCWELVWMLPGYHQMQSDSGIIYETLKHGYKLKKRKIKCSTSVKYNCHKLSIHIIHLEMDVKLGLDGFLAGTESTSQKVVTLQMSMLYPTKGFITFL
jgi:hypothetical protein